MQEPVRVLHIVGAMYPGGIENFLMNLYENIDRDRLQFDFAVHKIKENDYTQRIKEMGGNVHLLPRLTKNPIKSLRQLRALVKQYDYPVVIRHTPNALIAPQLMAAKMAGAVTVCHAHSETDSMNTLHKLGRVLLPLCCDVRYACSPKAGAWMFKKAKFEIVHNAIDIDRFCFAEEKGDKVRDEFELGECHVYGHIGNYSEPKNHMFLLEIFKEISVLDPKARFFCVGEGELRPQIEERRKELGLDDKVTLTGIRYDVENFMSCMDMLIFPSIYEGLPLTLVEAQAAGLPMVVSDVITHEVIVTNGLVEQMSLNDQPKTWAERIVGIVERYRDKNNRKCQRESIQKAGYDIKLVASWYQDRILECVDSNMKKHGGSK